MAYRGRLLVELNTVLGEEIEKDVVKMKESDQIQVQVKKAVNQVIQWNSFIHSSVHLFVYSSIHSFIHSFIHLLTYASAHPHTHPFIHSFIHSFIHTIST